MMKINYLHIAFLSLMWLQNGTAQTYCGSKGNRPWNEWIAKVQFGTINNASVKEGYGNFVSQTAAVRRGSTYPITVTQGFSWATDPSNVTQQGRVWIDFNQNGTFETDELAASFSRNATTTSIAIPTTAILGNTRMRIALKTIGIPTPCEIFDRGEIEDYTVNITAPAGAPNLLITNVTGPTSGKPGDAVTLKVSVANTGTGSSVPTRLQYRQKHYNNGYTTALCPQTVTIPALAPNESKVITYSLTLTNPIYPPNAIYVAASETFINHGFQDYLLMASNGDMSDQRPYYTEPKYVFNIPMTFPKTDIELSGGPNTVSLRENEPWRATYSIKNKGNFIVKQAFVNLGEFQNLGRNRFPGAYTVDSTSRPPVNTFIRTAGAETYKYGWEVFDLNPGETRNITLYFSPVVEFYRIGTTQLPPPSFNPFSNVIDTTDNFGLNTYIIYNGPMQPDLTLANLNLTNPSVPQGQILNYKFDLRNVGTGNASGNFNVKSYISRDNILSSDDIQDGIVPTGNFNAGFSVLQVPAASTIPATLATGQYYLILKADADNQIVEHNENNNVITSLPFQVTASNNNNCLNRYVLEGFNFYDNSCVRSLPSNFSSYGALQWYGATIETGFQATLGWSSNRANVFARNGSNMPPAGSNFRACAGNWVYFTAQGGSVIQDARSNHLEYQQLFIRIRIFGNAQNPDSLYLEVDTQNNNPNILLPPRFISSNKSLTCNTCFANDRIAPTIANCPTTPIVNYTLPVPTNFTGYIINNLFNLSVNDHCGSGSTFEYSLPNAIAFVTWDQDYDYKYVVFDSAGNKTSCAFRIHTLKPQQNSCKSYVAENTIDKCGSAPTWKPYGLKLYNYTTQQYEFYKIENAHLNTSGNKTVLTGTFRTASWQPVQVKAYFTHFPSNGYRGSACGTGIQDTTGWQFPLADSGKIVFPDKTLAISGQSYREGQLGIGANTQDLNVLGFYSVARCANVSNPANDYNAFFSFKLTNETACSALTASKSARYDSTKAQQATYFNLFPNPTQTEAFLDLKDFENQSVEITVSDVAGKAVLNQMILKATVLPHRLDVSRLQNGTYFVHLQIVGQRSVTRTMYIMN
jgi:GEVED domain/CARDB/Secretion system C-terminal sorting domain